MEASKQAVMKCKRCKCEIINPGYCNPCYEIIRQEKIDKINNRKLSKYKATKAYGVGLVKKYADTRCWCSSHEGCFRCSFGPNETPLHRDTKYERWKYHKELGRQVWCELILKEGFGKPDLIVADKGFIFCEEIVCSEKEASIVLKKKKYPFPINVIRTGDKNVKKRTEHKI